MHTRNIYLKSLNGDSSGSQWGKVVFHPCPALALNGSALCPDPFQNQRRGKTGRADAHFLGIGVVYKNEKRPGAVGDGVGGGCFNSEFQKLGASSSSSSSSSSWEKRKFPGRSIRRKINSPVRTNLLRLSIPCFSIVPAPSV